MKILKLEHNSPEWYQARLGLVTSSEFIRIIKPSDGTISKSKDGKTISDKAKAYAYILIAERMQNMPLEQIWTLDMEHGRMMEPTAAEQYELIVGMKTEGGFFLTDDKGMCGASPDRLVGFELVGPQPDNGFEVIGKAKGSLEIKCPKLNTHVKYMVEGRAAIEKDHKTQYQGHLTVGEDMGLEFVDFFSYHREAYPIKFRFERDEKFIKNLKESIEIFTCEVGKMVKSLVDRGYVEEKENAA